MTKKLTIILVLVTFSFSAFSQVEIKPAIGVDFSHFKDEGGYGLKGKTGFQVGGSVAFGKKFYFEPGIFWQKTNFEFNNTDGGEAVLKKGSLTSKTFSANAEGSGETVNSGFSTINIPLFVGFHFLGKEDSNFGLRVFAGPSAKFVISAVEEGGITKDDFNNLLWGINAGAGLDFWILFADLGYEWGLKDVFKNATQSTKNNHFTLNLGVRIRLGGK
jgi:hypothetical protein